MSIVFITIPGAAKTEFANELYRRTNGDLGLVLIQKPRRRAFWERLNLLYRQVGWRIFSEAWYALLLRLNPRMREALGYFRESTSRNPAGGYLAPTLEVDSVNSDAAYEALKRIAPSLIVVWGCGILEPRILSTAARAVNLHLGYCPHYRGALANQYAVLCGDISKIGATVHFINGKPDAGDIIAVIPGDAGKRPRELFRDLNDRAASEYLRVAVDLNAGKNLTAERQDISRSKNLLLRSWTPKRRYELGRKVLEWERRGRMDTGT